MSPSTKQSSRRYAWIAAFVTILGASLAIYPAAPPANNPRIQPYVGEWVGGGWGWEVRFKQSQREFVQQFPGAHSLPSGSAGEATIMSLMVRHATHYHFKVDESGNVTGEGEITYDLFPNLCGVAALTKQVNEQVNMMSLIPSIFKMATSVNKWAVKRENIEYFDEEKKLAERIAEIENAAKAYENDVKQFRKLDTLLMYRDEPEDVRKIASAVIYSKCFDPTQRIAGTNQPCLDLLVRPSNPEKLLPPPPLLLKAVFAELKHYTKDKLKGLDLQSERDAAACSGTGNALVGGLQVGPASAQDLPLQMLPSAAKAGMDMATGSAPVSMMLSIPGVTQVQYYYKGLTNGPESRDIKLKGHLEPSTDGAKLYLEMDGDVSDGDKRLFVEYMVNYRKEVHPFPTWSPFLDKPGDAQRSGIETIYTEVPTQTQQSFSDKATGARSTTNVQGKPRTGRIDLVMGGPFATFHETATQRNGVKVWHEYEYFWNAWKVIEPVPNGSIQ